jgi:predicted AAA+ superfamily ATPase
LTKSPTIYFNDLGMNNFARSQFGKSFENSGYIFQNFVFLLISSNFHKITDKVCFWRSKDKAEVDFVVKKDNELIPVEVKFSQLKKASISRSYRNFIGLYQPEQGFLVNLSLEEEIVIGNTKVSVVPYWKLI